MKNNSKKELLFIFMIMALPYILYNVYSWYIYSIEKSIIKEENYSVIDEYTKGEKKDTISSNDQIKEKTVNDELEGKNNQLSTETIEETPAVEETKPQENQAANFVTSGNVNLRNQPVIEDGNIITTLEEGKEVTIIEENAGEDQTWVKVSVDGQEGYISREYLVAR